jgi:hypothetical protein
MIRPLPQSRRTCLRRPAYAATPTRRRASIRSPPSATEFSSPRMPASSKSWSWLAICYATRILAGTSPSSFRGLSICFCMNNCDASVRAAKVARARLTRPHRRPSKTECSNLQCRRSPRRHLAGEHQPLQRCRSRCPLRNRPARCRALQRCRSRCPRRNGPARHSLQCRRWRCSRRHLAGQPQPLQRCRSQCPRRAGPSQCRPLQPRHSQCVPQHGWERHCLLQTVHCNFVTCPDTSGSGAALFAGRCNPATRNASPGTAGSGAVRYGTIRCDGLSHSTRLVYHARGSACGAGAGWPGLLLGRPGR